MGNCFGCCRNDEDILLPNNHEENFSRSGIGTETRTSRYPSEDHGRKQRNLGKTPNISRQFEALTPTSRGSNQNDLISFESNIRELRDIQAATSKSRSFAPTRRPAAIEPNNGQLDATTSRCTHNYEYEKQNRREQNAIIINRASTNKLIVSNSIPDALGKELCRLKTSKTIITKMDNILLNLWPVMDIKHVPHLQDNRAYSLEQLDANSERFLMRLFRNKRFNEKFEIIRAVRIWNPYLMLQYALNKKKYETSLCERHLYHGTGRPSLGGILTHNFDWRKVQEDSFGRGVYFANNPLFASHFSIRHGSPFIMIVAKVLIEIDEANICKGEPGMVLPIGHTAISRNRQEFVKFEDGCFYPEFLVFFRFKTLL